MPGKACKLLQIIQQVEPIGIFSAPFAKATYIPVYRAVMVVWDGVHTVEEYKKVIVAGLEFQKNSGYPVVNYISDIRNQGIVSPESRKWFEKVAIPRAVEQGLKHAAVVFDGNAFKRYYLSLILQVTDVYHLPLKFFNSLDDVFSWFSSVE